MDDEKKGNDFAFIKEKIKDKPKSPKEILRKLLFLFVGGFVFGIAAGLTFGLVKPFFESAFHGQEEQEIIEEPEPEPPPVTMPEEPVEIIRSLTLEDYQTLQDQLYLLGKQAAQSLVTVTAVTSETDWFENPVEKENAGTGLILENSITRILILTDSALISEESTLRVGFPNGETVEAQLLQQDVNSGLALLRISSGLVNNETSEILQEAVLGDSQMVDTGSLVVAVEGSAAANGPILPGNVTSVGSQLSTWDNNYTIFTTDMVGSSSGGVLVNLGGEIVGLILPGDTITALSISELAPHIERMRNAAPIPYLGLQVGAVTREMEENLEIPRGVYIREVALDSPAMEAGLQNADIVTAVGGEPVLATRRYSQILQGLEPGENVTITLMRLSGTVYRQLEITATLGP